MSFSLSFCLFRIGMILAIFNIYTKHNIIKNHPINAKQTIKDRKGVKNVLDNFSQWYCES